MIGIYGANGFIGRHLAHRLVAKNLRVRAVSRRFDDDFAEEFADRAEIVEADLRQPLDMASSLQDVEAVVQLVSTSSPGMKNDHAIDDILENVVPHVEFLRSCVQAGVKRYVFLSSGGTIYGPGAPVPTPETAPTNPINSYGITKLIVETYIRMHGHVDGLDHVILRVANPFGPGQQFRKGQGLIAAILERKQKGLPVRIFGDGRAMRDYVFIDDVIDAIEASLNLPGNPRHVVNIGSGSVRSVIEVVEAIEAATGQHFDREYVETRSTDVDIAGLDITRAKDVLGWAPKIGFLEGVERTVGNRYPKSHTDLGRSRPTTG